MSRAELMHLIAECWRPAYGSSTVGLSVGCSCWQSGAAAQSGWKWKCANKKNKTTHPKPTVAEWVTAQHTEVMMVTGVLFWEQIKWAHLLQLFIYTVLLFWIFSGFFWQKKPHEPPLSLGFLLGPALRRKTGAERAVAAVQRNNWNQHSHLGDICTCILLSTCLLCLPLRSTKGNKKLLTVS